MSQCKICDKPAGYGYILSIHHYDDDPMFTEKANNVLFKLWQIGRYASTVFHMWKLMDGKVYIDTGECINVLECTGMDMCEDIDMDEELHQVKIHDGKCQVCIAREQQLKLF